MVYLLEYFVVATDGQRGALDNLLTCRAATVDEAAEKARSIAKNFKFKEPPNLCIIKDQMGGKRREVALESLAA
jgi:hypothetical protein